MVLDGTAAIVVSLEALWSMVHVALARTSVNETPKPKGGEGLVDLFQE
jgi:hypothetical protein